VHDNWQNGNHQFSSSLLFNKQDIVSIQEPQGYQRQLPLFGFQHSYTATTILTYGKCGHGLSNRLERLRERKIGKSG